MWDGLTSQMERAGLDAPTETVALAGSGTGPIAGDYNAFVRFVNRFEEYSSLSPLADQTTIQATGGNIVSASNATPIVYVTEAVHGLTDGDFVKVDGVGGNTSANTNGFVTVIDSTSFSIDGSSGTADSNGGGTWISGVDSIVYTNLEPATDPRVVRRQILRNLDANASVYYVDIDTSDLSSTSLASTRTDDELSTQQVVPFEDLRGGGVTVNPANLNTPPPEDKPFIALYQSRMWYLGQDEYDKGSLQVEHLSTTVQGIGTDWKEYMIGRFLFITGSTKAYEIEDVSESAQTLTLVEPWLAATELFLPYTIRTSDADGELVYFSESGLPASVPATNAFFIPYDGDKTTGAMQFGSFLYVLKKHSIRKITVQDDPATDGAQFLAQNRGCINNRCWVKVDSSAYLLDTEGVYAFLGSRDDSNLSTPIQEIFRPDAEGYKINWEASRWFHAVHHPAQDSIYWFIALDGEFLPRHALILNYRLNRWSIDAYPFAIGAGSIGKQGSVQKVFLAGEFRQSWVMWGSILDQVSPTAGTVRGKVSSATLYTLTDVNASFPEDGIVNAPLMIVDGKGKGQVRRITSVSGATLTIKGCWADKPDVTSIYQIGAIPWKFKSGWFRFSPNEENMLRRLEFVFKKMATAATMDLYLYENFDKEPSKQALDQKKDGVASRKGFADLVLDLAYKDKRNGRGGFLQHFMPGAKELYAEGLRFSQFEMSGTPNQEEQRVYQVVYEGVIPRSGGQ